MLREERSVCVLLRGTVKLEENCGVWLRMASLPSFETMIGKLKAGVSGMSSFHEYTLSMQYFAQRLKF